MRMSRTYRAAWTACFRARARPTGCAGVSDDAVTIDVAIVVAQDANVLELRSRDQSRISRAITEMVGMPVLAINVRVQDVERPAPEADK